MPAWNGEETDALSSKIAQFYDEPGSVVNDFSRLTYPKSTGKNAELLRVSKATAKLKRARNEKVIFKGMYQV